MSRMLQSETFKTKWGHILSVTTSGNGMFFESAVLTTQKDLELNRDPQILNKHETENLLNWWQARGILL